MKVGSIDSPSEKGGTAAYFCSHPVDLVYTTMGVFVHGIHGVLDRHLRNSMICLSISINYYYDCMPIYYS